MVAEDLGGIIPVQTRLLWSVVVVVPVVLLVPGPAVLVFVAVPVLLHPMVPPVLPGLFAVPPFVGPRVRRHEPVEHLVASGLVVVESIMPAGALLVLLAMPLSFVLMILLMILPRLVLVRQREPGDGQRGAHQQSEYGELNRSHAGMDVCDPRRIQCCTPMRRFHSSRGVSAFGTSS